MLGINNDFNAKINLINSNSKTGFYNKFESDEKPCKMMKFCPLTRKLCDKMLITAGNGQPVTHICEELEVPLKFLEKCPK